MVYEDDDEDSEEEEEPIDWWEFWRDVDEGDPLVDQLEDERDQGTAMQKVRSTAGYQNCSSTSLQYFVRLECADTDHFYHFPTAVICYNPTESFRLPLEVVPGANKAA